jgi:hypothetical protein
MSLESFFDKTSVIIDDDLDVSGVDTETTVKTPQSGGFFKRKHKLEGQPIGVDTETTVKSAQSGGFFKRKHKLEGQPIGVNLIDFSQIVLSTVMGTYKPNDLLTVDLIRHIILNTLRANIYKNKLKYPQVVICVDNNVGGYWRKQKAWYYKFKRKQGRDDTGYDYKSIFESMAIVVQELKDNSPYYILDIESVEADDHIGVISNYCVEQNIPVLITSSDGDFTQLHCKLVKQFSPMQKKFVHFKHGSGEKDIRFKCIKGDKKDGIAPMKCDADHYTHSDGRRAPSVRAAELESIMNAKSADLHKVMSEENFKRFNENRELIDFKFIPEEICDNILTQYKNSKPAPRKKLFTYFASKKLDKLIDKINDF